MTAPQSPRENAKLKVEAMPDGWLSKVELEELLAEYPGMFKGRAKNIYAMAMAAIDDLIQRQIDDHCTPAPDAGMPPEPKRYAAGGRVEAALREALERAKQTAEVAILDVTEAREKHMPEENLEGMRLLHNARKRLEMVNEGSKAALTLEAKPQTDKCECHEAGVYSSMGEAIGVDRVWCDHCKKSGMAQQVKDLAQAFLEAVDDETQAQALVPDQMAFENACRFAKSIFKSGIPLAPKPQTDNGGTGGGVD